jgi:hypothetical protein
MALGVIICLTAVGVARLVSKNFLGVSGSLISRGLGDAIGCTAKSGSSTGGTGTLAGASYVVRRNSKAVAAATALHGASRSKSNVAPPSPAPFLPRPRHPAAPRNSRPSRKPPTPGLRTHRACLHPGRRRPRKRPDVCSSHGNDATPHPTPGGVCLGGHTSRPTALRRMRHPRHPVARTAVSAVRGFFMPCGSIPVGARAGVRRQPMTRKSRGPQQRRSALPCWLCWGMSLFGSPNVQHNPFSTAPAAAPRRQQPFSTTPAAPPRRSERPPSSSEEGER